MSQCPSFKYLNQKSQMASWGLCGVRRMFKHVRSKLKNSPLIFLPKTCKSQQILHKNQVKFNDPSLHFGLQLIVLEQQNSGNSFGSENNSQLLHFTIKNVYFLKWNFINVQPWKSTHDSSISFVNLFFVSTCTLFTLISVSPRVEGSV